MPNSYSYEELLFNGVFDFEDIEVKQIFQSDWTSIRSYYFPEEHDTSSQDVQGVYVDENDPVGFSNKDRKCQSQEDYTIDEFGQVVSRRNIGGGSNANTSSTSTSSSSYSQSYNTSSDDGNGWKIFLTIVAIIVFILITCTTGWGAVPAGVVGYLTLKNIWSDDF